MGENELLLGKIVGHMEATNKTLENFRGDIKQLFEGQGKTAMALERLATQIEGMDKVVVAAGQRNGEQDLELVRIGGRVKVLEDAGHPASPMPPGHEKKGITISFPIKLAGGVGGSIAAWEAITRLIQWWGG